MDLNRSPEEEERLKAQRLERFSNEEAEKRYAKLVAARARRRQQLSSTTPAGARLVGTCTLMCPEFEREERELKNNLAPQELAAGTRRADKHRAVKMFHRSAAGNEEPLPEDLRTPDTLVRTIDYLIDSVVGADQSLVSCHGFVRDRMRSVRQDFTIQNVRDERTVLACERNARFHIASLHVLCGHKDFAEQQDMEQLRNTLKTLLELYDDRRKAGQPSENEPEFAAYYVVAHLRDQDAKRVAERLPRSVFAAPVVQQALRLHMLSDSSDARVTRQDPGNRFAAQNLGVQFFRAVASPATPFLLACLAEYHFPAVRRAALRALHMAFPFQAGKQYPAEEVAAMLAFDSEDQVRAFCALFGIAVDERGVRLGERTAGRIVFNEPAQKVARDAPNLRVVGVKLRSSLMHVMKAPLDPAMLAPRPLMTAARPAAAPAAAAPAIRTSAFPKPAVASRPFAAAAQAGFGLGASTPFAAAAQAGFGLGARAASQPTVQDMPVDQKQQPLMFSASAAGGAARKPAKSVSFAPSAAETPVAAGSEAKKAPPLPSLFAPPAVSAPVVAAAKPQEKAPPLFSFAAPQPSAPPASASVPGSAAASVPASAPPVPVPAFKPAVAEPPPPPPPAKVHVPEPEPAPADVVWNPPRHRINYTSLTNTLYNDLVSSLVAEISRPLLEQSQQRAQVGLALAADIAQALVDYTAGFMAYEAAYKTRAHAQADAFRRQCLLRNAVWRWSMDAVARQQDRALQSLHRDAMARLVDQAYMGEPQVFTTPTATPRRQPIAPPSPPSLPPPPQPSLSVLPRDFWDSRHLGRAGFELVQRGLRRYAGPAFEATVGVAGVGQDVLASWLWWQIDPKAGQTPRSAVYTGPGAAGRAAGQRLEVRETPVDARDELSALVLLLAPEPLTTGDAPEGFSATALGTRIAALLAHALRRVSQRPAGHVPLLLVFWDGGEDPRVARRVRRLVERTAVQSGCAAEKHVLPLRVATAPVQLAEGVRWVCERVVQTQAARLVPVGQALAELSAELLCHLGRLRGPLAAARIRDLGGAACALFNCAVDTANAYVALANHVLLPLRGAEIPGFPPARPDTLGAAYFGALACCRDSPAVHSAISALLQGELLLTACIRALEMAAKLQLDTALHSVPPGAFADRPAMIQAAGAAARAADRCFASAVRLAAYWQPEEASLVCSAGGKRPADDDAMSVVSVDSTAPSYMSVSTAATASKRQRPGDHPPRLTRLHLALDRARRQLEQHQ
ncbi:actin cytoskeleton and mitosis protein [Coemansia interrupta]|uniref:Actin cytoskeleton and mitosis protein n=1 Tax=Coemansia interrupta TaxID=1126814 RepID=A0A9W8LJD2_9FUNG|nr:actin cytoskeleton and mitosis protein [Coemansia interrupta]